MEKIQKSTNEIFGKLHELTGNSIWNAFGTVSAPAPASGVYYDVESFYANTNINVGDNYKYVYNQFKGELKPRRFQRYTAGVKLTEEQMGLTPDSLNSMVTIAAQKQERALRNALEKDAIGYATEKALMSVLHVQPTAASSIVDPADCNSTPGTKLNAQAVNFTGAGQTVQSLNATIGVAQRGIASKVLDTTTGETMLRNDGTDTFDLWVTPALAKLFDTNKELIATGKLDTISFTQSLKQNWNTTVRPTVQIDNTAIVADATLDMVLTANTAENFFIVEVEKPTWTAWKEIDDGETISYVKRYKAGLGALARPFLSGTQAYKAMYAIDVTPNGA